MGSTAQDTLEARMEDAEPMAGLTSASSTSTLPAPLGGFGQPTSNMPALPIPAPVAPSAAPSIPGGHQFTIVNFPSSSRGLQQQSSAPKPPVSALSQQSGSSQPGGGTQQQQQQQSVLNNAVTSKFNGFGTSAASAVPAQPVTAGLFQSMGPQPTASALQQPISSGAPTSVLGASNLSFLQAQHANMSQPPMNPNQPSVLSGAPASAFTGFQTAGQAPGPSALFQNHQAPTGSAQQALSGIAPPTMFAPGLGTTHPIAPSANSLTSSSIANPIQQSILSGAATPQVTGFHNNTAQFTTPSASSQQAVAAAQPTPGAASHQSTLDGAQAPSPFHQGPQLPGSASGLDQVAPQQPSDGAPNGASFPTLAAPSATPRMASTFGQPSAAQTTVGVNGTASRPLSSLFSSASAPHGSASRVEEPSTSINAEQAGGTSGASSARSNGIAKAAVNPFATNSIAPPTVQSSSQSQSASGGIVTVKNGTAAINPFAPTQQASSSSLLSAPAASQPQPAVSASVPKKTAMNPFANKNGDATAQEQVGKNHQPTPAEVPSGPQTDFAKKIYDQLQKDGIRAPKWPAHPGNDAALRDAMDTFRETYKKYRERVRQSLIKADLIDRQDVQKSLADAFPFKGICEDMCPDFEKITRIVQNDVKLAEKVQGPDGTMCTSTPHMVKALARSAAGQEAPLPMDIRSVGALKRTLDYLIDEILVNDHNLPAAHNFLWDRTRAIRRDFVFHTRMSEQDLVDQVYCLESIARFHTIALHLLSQKGFAAEDFEEQQEIEQLGKTLLSLMEAYKACRLRKVVCKNEAEFRAYFIIHNAHASDIESKLQEWESHFWFNSNEVQTAVFLASSLKSTSDRMGPLRPAVPTTAAPGSYSTFLKVVASPKVSYTMACFAESHFKFIRRALLKNMSKSYARTRDAPKDITVGVLNEMLRFDNEEEAVEFAEDHGFEFSTPNGTTERHVILNKTVEVGNPTVGQSYSFNLVERKRGKRSLPDVIRSTVFEEAAAGSPVAVIQDQQDDLFVGDDAASGIQATPRSENAPATSSPINQASSTALGTERPTFAGVSTPAADPATLGKQTSAKATTPSASVAFPPQAASEAPLSAPAKALGAGSGISSTQSKSPAPPAAEQAPAGLFSSPQVSPGPIAAATSRAAPNITLTPPTPRFTPSTAATSTSGSENAKAQIGTGHQAVTQSASQVKSKAPASTLFSGPPPTKDAQAVSEKKTDSAQKAAKTAPRSSTRTVQSMVPGPVKSTSQNDTMGDFNKWFVLGDQGIVEQFTDAYIEQLANLAFEQYIREVKEQERQEEERKRKEEDEKSWAEARAFRKKSLMVTYFYRWRRIARNQSLNKRAQKAKADAVAWRAAQAKAKAEAKEKAAAAAAAESKSRKRKSAEEGSFLEELRESKRQRASLRASHNSNAEAALLATGVLSGVRDEQETAARVVRDASVDSDTPSVASAPAARVIRPPPRSLIDRLSSSVSRVKEIFKTTTSSSSSNKTPSGKQAIFSDDSIPDKVHYARDKNGKLNRVLPTRPTSRRMTNFDKSLSSSSRRTTPERKSSVRSAHWELRAMGLVHMPDNSYLHEDLAIPLLQGKRFPGIGTYGLPADPKDAETQAIKENNDRVRESPKYESPARTLARARIAARQAQSTSAPASASPPPSKRKRSPEDDEDEVVEITARQERSGSPSSMKKQKTTTAAAAAPGADGAKKDKVVTAKSAVATRYSLDDTDKLIQEHRKVMAELDAGQQWFREQRQLMERGNSPWDRVSVPR